MFYTSGGGSSAVAVCYMGIHDTRYLNVREDVLFLPPTLTVFICERGGTVAQQLELSLTARRSWGLTVSESSHCPKA